MVGDSFPITILPLDLSRPHIFPVNICLTFENYSFLLYEAILTMEITLYKKKYFIANALLVIGHFPYTLFLKLHGSYEKNCILLNIRILLCFHMAITLRIFFLR